MAVGRKHTARLTLRRIYEAPAKSDGRRILVDRLWPRGISKDKAQLFAWARDAAPSAGLRKWYHHDRTRWPDFKDRYLKELENGADLSPIIDASEAKIITLLYAAADTDQNHARVLRDFLCRHYAFTAD